MGHGTDFEEHVHEGMETSDGGFIAIGQTGEGSGSATDILIIKVDAEGQLEWQQQLGTSGQMDVGPPSSKPGWALHAEVVSIRTVNNCGP